MVNDFDLASFPVLNKTGKTVYVSFAYLCREWDALSWDVREMLSNDVKKWIELRARFKTDVIIDNKIL